MVYGIDLNKKYYYDYSKRVGWVLPLLCSKQEVSRYRLLVGKDCVERMDEIGQGIDFCILDTTHLLPAELLQFFAVYPHLKNGAVLVVHDIALNFLPDSDPTNIVTKSAFASQLLLVAAGSKCKMLPDKENANIAAFIVDEETARNLNSTFMALAVSWFYWQESHRKVSAIHSYAL